jgi:uncharacterized protein (UPF0335 family)
MSNDVHDVEITCPNGLTVKTTTAELKAKADKASRGHNSVAAGQLRSFVERIERLEEEKKAIADDIKDVKGEAKAHGFDVKVLNKVIAIRKQDQAERQEQEALLDLYLGALGMTPLERAIEGDAEEGDA